jgi:membrane protein
MDQTLRALETPGIDDCLGWKIHLRRLLSFRWRDLRSLFGMTISNWYSHNAPRLCASLAFYTLLSLAPLLVIVIAIAGAAFGRSAAQGQLVWQIEGLIGRPGAEVVQLLLASAHSPGRGTIASILGFATLFYGATSVVAELRSSLNTIWCVPIKEQTGLRSLVSLLVDRTVAFAAVVGVGFLLLVSLTINAALAALGQRFHASLPSPEFLLQSMDLIISYGVITILFALIYKLLPDLYLEWRDVIPGALFTALLFSTGKVVIGMYLGKATVASAYGAAGSLVVLLFWVYYSAQIFFLGAEFTQVYAQLYGSKPCDHIDKKVERVTTLAESPVRRDLPENEPLIKIP